MYICRKLNIFSENLFYFRRFLAAESLEISKPNPTKLAAQQ